MKLDMQRVDTIVLDDEVFVGYALADVEWARL
jgi:hypothetical protein